MSIVDVAYPYVRLSTKETTYTVPYDYDLSTYLGIRAVSGGRAVAMHGFEYDDGVNYRNRIRLSLLSGFTVLHQLDVLTPFDATGGYFDIGLTLASAQNDYLVVCARMADDDDNWRYLVLVDATGTTLSVADDYYVVAGNSEDVVVDADVGRVLVISGGNSGVVSGESGAFLVDAGPGGLTVHSEYFNGDVGTTPAGATDGSVGWSYQSSNMLRPFSVAGSAISYGTPLDLSAYSSGVYGPWGAPGSGVVLGPGYFAVEVYVDADSGNVPHYMAFTTDGSTITPLGVGGPVGDESYNFETGWFASASSGVDGTPWSGALAAIGGAFNDVNPPFSTNFYATSQMLDADPLWQRLFPDPFTETSIREQMITYSIGTFYALLNGYTADADEDSAVYFTILNFGAPNLAGEFEDNDRFFWRPRPGDV